ncbi:MAG TPA: site-specific integrase [bacterium]|nr:site-specific integrase [bacterium]
MARKPVSVFKRPATKKGQFRYYVKLWDELAGCYSSPRSVASVAVELGLDFKSFPPTSRTGAMLIGEQLRQRGGAVSVKDARCSFVDYCADFWDWEKSDYIKNQLVRNRRIGREYASHCAGYVKNYISKYFQGISLGGVKLFMLEGFALSLKENGKLSNRSINAILMAATVPLHEAARVGRIPADPARGVQFMGNDTREKGIPTEYEVSALLSLEPIDLRVRVAMLLAASCAMRIGEIQALTMAKVGASTILVDSSWGKVDGLKSTKTGRGRPIPVPQMIRELLVKLDESNPHGPGVYLMYGKLPDAPVDVRWLERGFDEALIRVALAGEYAMSDREAKKAALASWRQKGITFHSLRHWGNSMLQGSVSDERLRLLTGHSTEAMTDHYSHATASDLEALAKAQETKILPFLKPASGA